MRAARAGWRISLAILTLAAGPAAPAPGAAPAATGPAAMFEKQCYSCHNIGSGDKQGTFTINADLRSHTKFRQINLNQPIPEIGKFHVIFLRNVMIYFDNPTKRQVVSKLVSKLHPGGYLIIGHSESLNGLTEQLTVVQPTIYKLP